MTAASRGANRRTELAARLGLALVALGQAEIGVWGLLAPHSFYASYPGAGRHWVSVLGPYDEHLIRDFAATELGFAVLLACAVVWFERRLVLVTGAAFLAATLPHFAYHLTTTDRLSTADDVASLVGFAIELALVVVAMVVVAGPSHPSRNPASTPAGSPTAARGAPPEAQLPEGSV